MEKPSGHSSQFLSYFPLLHILFRSHHTYLSSCFGHRDVWFVLCAAVWKAGGQSKEKQQRNWLGFHITQRKPWIKHCGTVTPHAAVPPPELLSCSHTCFPKILLLNKQTSFTLFQLLKNISHVLGSLNISHVPMFPFNRKTEVNSENKESHLKQPHTFPTPVTVRGFVHMQIAHLKYSRFQCWRHSFCNALLPQTLSHHEHTHTLEYRPHEHFSVI